MIAIVGWPRSGTHWLKAMLEHALGEEVAQSHVLPEAAGKYVLIVRDPRDTFASHWRLYKHDRREPCTELQFVDLLMKGQMESNQGWNVGWVPYMQKLMGFRGIHPFVRYEGLRDRPEETLIQVLAGAGRDVPQLRYIVKAVHETRDVRCDPSTLPVDVDMGMPGKWEHELQPETVRALEQYCGKVMDELGYARRADG